MVRYIGVGKEFQIYQEYQIEVAEGENPYEIAIVLYPELSHQTFLMVTLKKYEANKHLYQVILDAKLKKRMEDLENHGTL